MKPALLFWCQHSVGLGHLARAHALCAALVERFRVVLVCGGALPDGIAPPPGVEVVPLPPLGVGPAGAFVSHDPRAQRRGRVDGPAQAAPRHLRRHAVRASILVELWPFGRAKFGRELLPLLERAAARRRARRSPACATSSSAAATTSASTTPARARSRTRTSTACSCTAIPRSRAWSTRSAPQARLRVPVRHTGFVVAERPAPAAGRRDGRRRVGRRRARRRAAVARGARRPADPLAADRAADAPDRRPVPPRRRSGRAGRCRGHRAGRDVRPQRRRARRRSWTAPRRRSASAATTPRSSWCRRACPRWSSRTRRPRRTSSGAARGGSPGSARCACSNPSGSRREPLADAILALDDFVPAPRGARPRRRARDHRAGCGRNTARRPGSHEPRRPRAPPVRRSASGARSPAPAARRSALTAADLAKPWPLALSSTVCSTGGPRRSRSTPADVRLLVAVSALVLVIALVEAGAQYVADLRLQIAGERIAHELRIERLRPPPAPLARLPPAPPEGRPADARDERRQRDGRPVRAVARPDHPGGAALGRDARRAAVARPGARARRGRDVAAAGGRELGLPPARAVAGARAAHPRGPDRLDRGRGAVGDDDRQGVRVRAARVRPRAPRQRGADGGGRRGRAAAGALRRPRRRRPRDRDRGSCSWSACCASRTARSPPAS